MNIVLLYVLIIFILIAGPVSGREMSDSSFSCLIRSETGSIDLEQWEIVISQDADLKSVPDKVGTNPFTQEQVIFPGAGKAYYIESSKIIGNISLENGDLNATGVPLEKCEELSKKLKSVVVEVDRS